MGFLILATIIVVQSLFIVSALNRIEQLKERIEEIEFDHGYGNW